MVSKQNKASTLCIILFCSSIQNGKGTSNMNIDLKYPKLKPWEGEKHLLGLYLPKDENSDMLCKYSLTESDPN